MSLFPAQKVRKYAENEEERLTFVPVVPVIDFPFDS